MTSGREVRDLTVAFIAETTDAAGPWQQLLEVWADERRLSPATRRALRVAVIRARCFGRPR